MAKKRKYDTEALVGQIKRERRVSFALTVGGLFILAFIAGLYAMSTKSEGEIPPGEVGASGPPTTATGTASGPAATGPSTATAEPTPAAPTEPVAEKPASLTISTNKPTMVFLDGKKIGKVTKKKTMEVSAGKHTVSVKIGKKNLEQEIDLAGGQAGEVSIDVKKKRVSAKKS